MSKILITGGAGFIGSHVVRRFVNNYPNDIIVNLDKLTYAGNLENLRDIEKKPNYHFIKGDIVDAGFINNLFEEEIEVITETDYTLVIMEKLFKQGNYRPKTRQLTFLKEELSMYNQQEISKEFRNLKSNGLIFVNGSACHLSKEGIVFFNQRYNRLSQ